MSTAVTPHSTAQRIIPGEFWYAYGSVAIDLTLFDSPSSDGRPRLSVCETADTIAPATNDALHGESTREDECAQVIDCAIKDDTLRLAGAAAAIIALLLFGILSAFSMGQESRDEIAFPPDGRIATEVVSVNAGETLWGIAAAHPIAGMSTQECIKWIMETNELSDVTLRIGQSIVVPRCQ